MRKLIVAVAVLFVPVVSSAQQQDFSKVEIKVQKIAGNVYMLQGAGGNIGVSAGDDGIVIVDEPLRFVINTHWHGDHTGGNPIFSRQAPIIAQENVRKRLATGRKGPGPEIPPQPANVLPVVTFEDKVSVHLNGEDILAIHFPKGHTDGDSVIFFPQANVLHMGDDFVTYGFPYVDLNSGGTVRGLIDALRKVVTLVPPNVKVIPGHGDLSTLDDVRAFTKMVEETFNLVSAQVSQGKSADEIKKSNVLAAYSKYSGDFVNTDRWIDTIYTELKGAAK